MILIGLLILGACAGVAAALLLMKREQTGRLTALVRRLEESDQAGSAADGATARKLPAWLQRMMPSAVMASYEERLLWVGRPFGLDAVQFVTLKLVTAGIAFAVVPLLLLFRLNSTAVLLMLLTGLLGFVLPDLWLGMRLAERKRVVAEELPLFADLIATAVGAGLPLTEAVRRVAADAPGLVAREFLRAVQEMAAGKPRLAAWRDLSFRLPTDEFRTIVSAVMQAEQYGTSVAEMLRYQVEQLRLFKQQEAQRIAQSVTVKMRIPMLLLILLPFMVLLLAPAVYQIVRLLH